jgi:hypothetical protein
VNKKDYALIAKTLREAPLTGGVRVVLAKRFAEAFKTDNESFDRLKFIVAATREKDALYYSLATD